MTSASNPRINANVVWIEGELTIYRADELKQALLAEIGHGGDTTPLEINLSGVTDIDTAGVQLLLLAKKTAQAQQRELHLVAHSPVVIDVFELLNLAASFGDPLVMAARSPVRASNES